MTYVLELEPEIAQRFEEQAAQNGTTPQEMLLELVKSRVDGGRKADALGEYLRNKNAELYRRLA